MRHRSVKPVSIKLLLALFAAGFGIFFGVDVATRGIERINGPIDAAASVAQMEAKTAQPLPASGAQAGQPKTKPDTAAVKTAQGQEQPAGKQQAVIEESAVNRVSNGIGEVLRRAANVCLKVIVSVFEAIFG
ncbi:hypothetical protein [Paenibacillus contaminans]|uniref:Translation initiation factor 2 n=1 Tax=Paenibacillus contaminans TaxID=450362 RepID=A0A329MV31_9BACL|nr:hypothetical protein [Paenibacillus contaminans]RAV21807.1 hypothetical protein DQG23_07040 [Paenibacillus contaminans]